MRFRYLGLNGRRPYCFRTVSCPFSFFLFTIIFSAKIVRAISQILFDQFLRFFQEWFVFIWGLYPTDIFEKNHFRLHFWLLRTQVLRNYLRCLFDIFRVYVERLYNLTIFIVPSLELREFAWTRKDKYFYKSLTCFDSYFFREIFC